MSALVKWDEPQPVKLTVEDFLRLDGAGAFAGYAKTELIDGVVVAMNAQFQQHAWIKGELFLRLATAVAKALPDHRALVEVSMSCPPAGLPEPDILVTTAFRGGREPVPAETVRLVIEVADTTLRFDLGAKATLYAAAAIPEYWVVDIDRAMVHRLWAPVEGRYLEGDTVPFGRAVAARTAAGLAIEADWS